MHMILDRAQRDAERDSDLTVRVSRGNNGRDLLFARRQARQAAVLSSGDERNEPIVGRVHPNVVAAVVHLGDLGQRRSWSGRAAIPSSRIF